MFFVLVCCTYFYAINRFFLHRGGFWLQFAGYVCIALELAFIIIAMFKPQGIPTEIIARKRWQLANPGMDHRSQQLQALGSDSEEEGGDVEGTKVTITDRPSFRHKRSETK